MNSLAIETQEPRAQAITILIISRSNGRPNHYRATYLVSTVVVRNCRGTGQF
jgi:hypothetical protein